MTDATTWKVWVEDKDETVDPDRVRPTIEASTQRAAALAYVAREGLTTRPLAICVQRQRADDDSERDTRGAVDTVRLSPGD